MQVTYTDKQFIPFTNIYVVRNNKILLLLRKGDKKMWPDKLLGIGGKVEPGEDLFSAARREFFEETGGCQPSGLQLKGTFSWEDETHQSGINYIFKASGIKGKLKKHSEEGELIWFDLALVFDHQKFAEHQKLYLKAILGSDFYCSHSVFSGHFNNGDIVSYTDNQTYFLQRAKNIKT